MTHFTYSYPVTEAFLFPVKRDLFASRHCIKALVSSSVPRHVKYHDIKKNTTTIESYNYF